MKAESSGDLRGPSLPHSASRGVKAGALLNESCEIRQVPPAHSTQSCATLPRSVFATLWHSSWVWCAFGVRTSDAVATALTAPVPDGEPQSLAPHAVVCWIHCTSNAVGSQQTAGFAAINSRLHCRWSATVFASLPACFAPDERVTYAFMLDINYSNLAWCVMLPRAFCEMDRMHEHPSGAGMFSPHESSARHNNRL
jgi:hypothetical protein